MLAALLSPAIVGIVMFLASVVWMLRDERDKSRQILAAAILLNLFYGWGLNVLTGHADSLLPWKYDYYLYRMDLDLGLPAASVARALAGVWSGVLEVVYQLLLPMMIAWLLLHRGSDRRALIWAYVAEMLVGPMLYMVVPACGPRNTFGASWLEPHHVPAELIRVSGPPNAFPSLHVATALVLVMLSRGRGWRAISLAFLAGTALSTLTTGEHHVIDLVPGLSFGCFAAAVGRRDFSRAAAYLAVTAGWSLAVRWAGGALVVHTAWLESAVFLTIAMSLTAVRHIWQLGRANEPAIHPQGQLQPDPA